MGPYLAQWAISLLVWFHVVAAIAWIGESFYFVMLDNILTVPHDAAARQAGVAGEVWSVHGGGFYHAQKYTVAPPRMPEQLHWSKWKAYATWLSGFGLFTALYLLQPGLYLIDPSVAALTGVEAAGAALGFLVVGWLVYDLLCRRLGDNDLLLGGLIALFVAAACFAATHLFAPQPAFLIVGAMLGTIMAANVFVWIMPGQRAMVDALARGRVPDPEPGRRGKQRSVHNTYFTLPVVFAMLSGHFGMLYGGPWSWALLWLVMLAGALIRQFFVLWHLGQRVWALPAAGAVLVAAVVVLALPRSGAGGTAAAANAAPGAARVAPTVAGVMPILWERCAPCHSAHPALMPAPPAGVVLDSPAAARAHATLIGQMVGSGAMPLGNVTHITSAERAEILAWVAGGAK